MLWGAWRGEPFVVRSEIKMLAGANLQLTRPQNMMPLRCDRDRRTPLWTVGDFVQIHWDIAACNRLLSSCQ